MIKLRAIIYTPLRTYSKKYVKRNPLRNNFVAKGTLRSLLEKETDINIEDHDFDPSQDESDFMSVAQSHKSYEKELIEQKQLLKQQITVRKYFDEKQPSFLTFAEREQIKSLHGENPKEWTIDRLSESFPALPQTIKKILKSKWIPNSVDNVLKYDERILENWKKFKTGDLPVDFQLRNHLLKFKDRKLIMSEREALAKKFVPPKFELPEPKSTFFSKLIENSIKENKQIDRSTNDILEIESNCKEYSDSSNCLKESVDLKQYSKQNKSLTLAKKDNLVTINRQNENEICNKKFTFEDFLKDNIKDIDPGTSDPEKMTLLDVYKKEIEKNDDVDCYIASYKNTELQLNSQEQSEYENALITPDNTNKYETIMDAQLIDYNSIETGIKIWKKKTEGEENYSARIKIPKGIFKKGATYRIVDCYYDDDGEFLYRVPGLRN